MTRATFTTKKLRRPANLYASMPAVPEKELTQDELDAILRRASRANNRKVALAQLENERHARNEKIIVVAVTVVAVLLVAAALIAH